MKYTNASIATAGAYRRSMYDFSRIVPSDIVLSIGCGQPKDFWIKAVLVVDRGGKASIEVHDADSVRDVQNRWFWTLAEANHSQPALILDTERLQVDLSSCGELAPLLGRFILDPDNKDAFEDVNDWLNSNLDYANRWIPPVRAIDHLIQGWELRDGELVGQENWLKAVGLSFTSTAAEIAAAADRVVVEAAIKDKVLIDDGAAGVELAAFDLIDDLRLKKDPQETDFSKNVPTSIILSSADGCTQAVLVLDISGALSIEVGGGTSTCRQDREGKLAWAIAETNERNPRVSLDTDLLRELLKAGAPVAKQLDRILRAWTAGGDSHNGGFTREMVLVLDRADEFIARERRVNTFVAGCSRPISWYQPVQLQVD